MKPQLHRNISFDPKASQSMVKGIQITDDLNISTKFGKLRETLSALYGLCEYNYETIIPHILKNLLQYMLLGITSEPSVNISQLKTGF